MFRHLYYLLSVMLLYFFESIIIGFFIYLAWKYILHTLINIEIIYFQWVAIVWVIKMLFYDVLKNNQLDENKIN